MVISLLLFCFFRKEVRFQLDPKTPFDIVIKELKLQCNFKREQQFTLKWLDIDGITKIYIVMCVRVKDSLDA